MAFTDTRREVVQTDDELNEWIAVAPRGGACVRPRPSLARQAAGTGAGLLLVLAIVAARTSFPEAFAGRSSLIELTLPLAVAATIGGFIPGTITTLFGLCVSCYVFLGPPTFGASTVDERVRIGAFFLLGLFISIVCDRFLRLLARAEALQKAASENEAMLREHHAMLAARSEERRRSAENFRRLFDSSNVCVGVWKGANFIEFNDALLELLGYSRGEIDARGGTLPWADVTPREFVPRDEEALLELQQTGRCAPYEKEYLRKDGSRVPVLIVTATLLDPDGHAGIGYALNLSRIKIVENDLREARARAEQSLAKLRAIVDHMAEGVVIGDPGGIISYMNRAALGMYGVTPSETVGRPLTAVFQEWEAKDASGELVPFNQSPLSRALGGERFTDEVHHVSRAGSGRVSTSSYSGTPVYDDEGRLVCAIVTVHDVSERVERERNLREATTAAEMSLTKIEAILGSIAESVAVCDADGTFISLNDAARSVFGNKLIGENRVGSNVRDYAEKLELASMDGRSLPLEEWPIMRAIRGESFSDYEVLVRWKGATDWMVMCYAGKAVRDREGRVELGVITARDVTAQKRANEERDKLLESERAAREEAQRASRLKDDFLATVSHELRTPLTAISGWAQILRKPGRAAEQITRGLAVIDRNTHLLTQLISDLLDVGRIVSGKLKLEVLPSDVGDVLDGALESVRYAADAKGIRLARRLEPKTGPILADPARLQQIVWNLLSNAIKFTPRGGLVEVSCSVGAGLVEISVVDTGQGIAREFLPHVFERFRQADASAARQHGGLGLGLAIVRHLVELHGGRVRAESEGAGRGARFIVELPFVAAASEAPVAEDVSAAGRYRISSSQRLMLGLQELAGACVLVVEDEADTRELVHRLLEEYEVSVLSAASATEALAILEGASPDVLVSDLGMPGMDGFALIREIRVGLSLGPNELPAVAVTAFARQEDKRRALASGFQVHVEKPIDPVELVAAVSGLFLMRKGALAATTE
jgi:PAS domain S-box-containing protein